MALHLCRCGITGHGKVLVQGVAKKLEVEEVALVQLLHLSAAQLLEVTIRGVREGGGTGVPPFMHLQITNQKKSFNFGCEQQI